MDWLYSLITMLMGKGGMSAKIMKTGQENQKLYNKYEPETKYIGV